MFKKLITVFLVLVIAFSLVACQSEEGQKPSDNTLEVTGEYIIKDFKTDYILVASTNPGSLTNIGIAEFAAYFEEATGINLPIKKDNEVTYTTSSKFISIGETSIIETAGVDKKIEQLKDNGVRMVTKDSSLFLFGKNDKGSYNAVLKYLNLILELDFVDDECYYINKNVYTIPLHKLDVVDNPDINYNMPVNGSIMYDTELGNHLGYELAGSYFIKGVMTQHNVFDYLPKEIYEESHPEFYSISGLELCHNARGVEGSRDLMIEEIAKKMVSLIKADPNGKCLSFTHNDYNDYCNCTFCNEEKEQYGTNAGSTIKFANDLKFKLDSLCEAEGVRKVPIAFFAYQRTEKAPVKYVNGEPKPIDDSVKCIPGVWVYYAPVYDDYTKPLEAEGPNSSCYKTLKEWSSLSESIILWLYELQFNNYFMPYGYYNAIQSWFQGAKMVNANFMFNQGELENAQHTAFRRLTIYLTSKLAWDVNADMDKLMADFFRAAFGPAATAMYKFFQEEMVHMNYNYDVLDMSGSVLGGQPLVIAKYWPKNVLNTWLSYIDDAYKAIEPLKATDPEQYDIYRRSILQEKVSLDFMMIEAHGNTFTAEELLARKLQCKADIKEVGITRVREGGAIFVEDVFASWGV